MKRILFAALVTAVVVFPLFSLPLRAETGVRDPKIEVAQRFLRAYFLKNEKVTPYVPDKSENLFAPYPFKGPVQFFTPKVHGNQAMLKFKGAVIDSNLPQRGGILFYNHNWKWHIRQVLFYDRVPTIFGLPTKSVTTTDRKFEPEVRAMGEEFMAVWEKSDVDKMLVNWFDWPNSPGDPIKGLHMSNIKIDARSTTWGDPYLRYTVDITYRWGILSYSMTLHGGLILVQEDGEWKVRGNELVFKW